jgi:hypothetical protein
MQAPQYKYSQGKRIWCKNKETVLTKFTKLFSTTRVWSIKRKDDQSGKEVLNSHINLGGGEEALLGVTLWAE